MGWMQTTPDLAVTVSPRQVIGGLDFGNFKLGAIEGHKFDDRNGNGVWDHPGEPEPLGEPGLAGWTINLDKGGDGSMGPGTYRLSEGMQAGWFQTVGPPTITMFSGDVWQNENFGNQEPLIKSVEWIGLTSPLSANPNAGGGLRIFPDKIDANDKLKRDQVLIRVTLNRKIQNVEITARVIDVDDPSTNDPIIDDENLRADNREEHFLLAAMTKRTNADGVVEFLFDHMIDQPQAVSPSWTTTFSKPCGAGAGVISSTRHIRGRS